MTGRSVKRRLRTRPKWIRRNSGEAWADTISGRQSMKAASLVDLDAASVTGTKWTEPRPVRRTFDQRDPTWTGQGVRSQRRWYRGSRLPSYGTGVFYFQQGGSDSRAVHSGSANQQAVPHPPWAAQ